MSRMIRCIEGHVFDADKNGKCPECGWTPKQSAGKKIKRGESTGLSLGQRLSAFMNTLTEAVERVLQAIGIRNKPGLAAGIVYAVAILLCVTAVSALPGSPLWPGRWGKEASISPDIDPNKSPTVGPQVVPTPAPPGKKDNPAKKSADATDPPDGGTPPPDSGGPGQAAQRQRVIQPQIHVPHDVRRLLRFLH